jgi:hypothetical protein
MMCTKRFRKTWKNPKILVLDLELKPENICPKSQIGTKPNPELISALAIPQLPIRTVHVEGAFYFIKPKAYD